MNATILQAPAISPNLRLFLHFASWKGRDMRADGRGTLGFADELLRDIDDIEAEISRFDGFEPFDQTPHQIGDRSIPKGRHDLNQEFFAILDVWGELYPIDILLNASENGLSTQMPVKDIAPGNGFEIDGKLGDGKVIMQFQVVEIDESLQQPGKVAYRITHGQARGDNGKIRAMDENTLVRPLLPDDFFGMNAVGSSFDDPEKFVRYKADQDEYRAASDAIEARIEAAVDGKVVMIYSAGPYKDNGTPIDNLDDVAVEGPVILVQASDYDEDDAQADFDDEPYGDFESEVLESPTWLTVAVEFNKAVQRTGDYHHSFLEGVYLDKKATEARGDGVKVVRFATGS
jgi:hypothetical protein